MALFCGGSANKLLQSDTAFNFISGEVYMAFSAWVRFSAFSNYQVIARFGTGSTERIYAGLGGGSYGNNNSFAFFNGHAGSGSSNHGVYTTTATLTLNTWHHMFYWYDGATTEAIYRDGVDMTLGGLGTRPSFLFTPTSTTDYEVGGLTGSIAEVAWWFGGFPGGGTSEDTAVISALAAGYSPLLFRQNLVVYHSLRTSPWGDEFNNVSVSESGTVSEEGHPNIVTSPINVTPQTATANYINRSTGKFISHEDMGSPSAGDMMRLRALRDYDHVANTDDMQLHKLVLWQKGDA